MHLVGKINKDIYKCVTTDIATDEVIITDNQIQHIKDRHPNDYERFSQYLCKLLRSRIIFWKPISPIRLLF